MTVETRLPSEVSPTELSRSEWIGVIWGFAWRGVAFTVASTLAGGVAGAVLGFIVGLVCTAMGIPAESWTPPLRVAGFVVGLVIGLWLLTFYIRWLLRSRFGSLRLALIRTPA
jgi:ABC-type nickel/cobalt efflux system permease component RcnA